MLTKKSSKSKIFSVLVIIFSAFLFSSCATMITRNSRLISPEEISFPALKFDIPQADRVVLKNGIIVYILEDHELPVVNLRALIKTGSIYDPEGKKGVADLTAYLMRTGGTRILKSDEIDKRLDYLAASASISMHADYASADFSVLSKDLEEGLNLLSQMLITPAFEKKKLELAVQLKREDLRRLQDNPQRLAFREFNRLIYQNDPRGKLTSNNSLDNISRSDLINFHRLFFHPNNIMFSITGDITRQQAVEILTKHFGNWEKGPAAKKIPAPSSNPKGGIFYLPKDIPQSTIVTGQFAPGKHNPDYYAFNVLDFIAGSGGFNSRIFSAVRNNEGLAYSAGSFYRAHSYFGVFGTYAFTKTSSTIKTLSLINSVLDDLNSNNVNGGELSWAKESINNNFIFSFTSAESIANLQMGIEFQQLPSDYLEKYRNRIENVSLEDIKRLANSYLDKSNNVVLILGDYKNFDKPSNQIPKPVVIKQQD
jgi:predicted Zn-dependent peptidase